MHYAYLIHKPWPCNDASECKVQTRYVPIGLLWILEKVTSETCKDNPRVASHITVALDLHARLSLPGARRQA